MLASLRRIRQVLFAMLRLGRELYFAEDSSRPALLRRAIEELSGTFIKFGQMMALRPDVVPKCYCYELFRLLDRVPSFPYLVVREIVEADLGQPPEELFETFEAEPLASASFGQVHVATIEGGQQVAVKVQRPGIRRLVETDLRIMSALSLILDRTGLLGVQKLKPIVEEFARWTREELDYAVEARYNDSLFEASQSNPRSKIPKPYWDYISHRVLTNEYLDGLLLSQIMEALHSSDQEAMAWYRQQGIDLMEVADNLWDVLGEQIYVHGVFHADPHPANILILENNVIGFVDFGIIGRMSQSLQSKLIRVIKATLEEDIDRSVDVFLEIAPPTPRTDLQAFRREYTKDLETWLGAFSDSSAPFEERSFSAIFARNLWLIHKYELEASPQTLAWFRTLLAIDSITLQIAPGFGSSARARGFFRMLSRRKQRQLQEQLRSPEFVNRLLLRYSELLLKLPHSLLNFLEELEEGRSQLWIKNGQSWRLEHGRNARTRVVAISVLVLSLALILNAVGNREVHELPLFYLCSGALIVVGLWLVLALRGLR